MDTETLFRFTRMPPGFHEEEMLTSDELIGVPAGFTKRHIELLNSAGILMEGNCYLYVNGDGKKATYYVAYDADIFYRISGTIPPEFYDDKLGKSIDLREEIQSTLSQIKPWIGGNKVSKRMLGKAVIINKLYPDLDKEVFISVLKNDLSLKNFMNLIQLGKGSYNEELIEVATLPAYLLDRIMGKENS